MSSSDSDSNGNSSNSNGDGSISYMSRWKQTNHHHHHHNMIKSNSLSELCLISESIKISDSSSSGIKDNSSSGGRSPVSIVSSSPLSNDKVYLSATSSPLRTPQPQPMQIYESPARLSVPSTKKRSLTLSDFNEDQGFIHLESSSYVSTNFIELVKAADEGIKKGQNPYLCDEACGGTYFLRVSLIIILSLTLLF